MKKILSLFLATLMLLSLFTACAQSDAQTETETENLKIVATIFPVYDWTVNILGDEIDNVDLTLLLDSGVDLHSYEPTAEDMVTILECDLFIYVGGESDYWVDDVLQNSTNENMQVINLFDVLGDLVKEEEIVEGMEHEHDEDSDEDSDESSEEDHEHDEDCEDDCEEESEDDEHVWLSLSNAIVICNSITNSLNEIDKNNSDVYNLNNEAYIGVLEELDDSYEEVIANSSKNTLLFGDRFPFRYLVDDYDIEYFAAFAGCSAETEASFDTITFLAEKVDELELNVVLAIDGSDQSIANTIVENTTDKDQEILVLNSMQSVSSSDIADGVTYISIMEDNLLILEEALK